MASPLVQASLAAPGFLGLNTEQQAANTQERFATTLDNAIFDEAGKVVCRKGYSVLASGTPDTVDRVFWWRKDSTTSKLMSVGDATGAATLYEMTTTTDEFDTFTSRGTMNSVDVALVNVNGQLAVIEQGQSPKVWDGTGTLANFAAATGTTANPTGGVSISAFGRLFVTSSDGVTVHGSELQPDPKTTGINWDNWYIDTTGNSGASAKDGWTYGRDFITGLGALGDFLIIFGAESIQVYTDINGTPTLTDSITGVGCVNQHTIKNVGDDLVFLSNSGLRSLRRVLEKQSPQLNDLSVFVRSGVQAVSGANAMGVFSPLDGFYLLSDGSSAYCFDIRQTLPGGARRSSSWDLTPSYAAYDPEDNRLFLAVDDGVCEYTGYLDDTSTYQLTLKSAWLNIKRVNIKIVKKLGALIYGGSDYTPRFFLAYDWNEETEDSYYAESLAEASSTGAEWGLAEWSLGEWSGVNATIGSTSYRYVSAGGSGLYVRYGLQFTIDGYEVGIHEIRLQAKLGKLAHV